MENTPAAQTKYSSDVHYLKINGKEFFIIGTAHISQNSADLVREVISNEKPDVVCVELDPQRYKALSESKRWEELDLKQLIKQKQLSTLFINILLASYQKKLGEKLGVKPGVELLEATKVAKEFNIPIELVDRDVRITLKRAWNSMSFWQKTKLMTVGLASVFEQEEISEEKLDEIKQKDVLNEMMAEMGKQMPVLKKVLIDERDSYLTQKMKEANGTKIVSVVGAGHVNGIIKALESNLEQDLSEIEVIPSPSKAIKIIGYGIPTIIIASLFYIGFTKGADVAGDNVIFWILANGIPSAFGALLALGHPLTILSAFLGAPITSLTPVIGAGYVAAFVQAYYQPPKVKEFESVTEDVSHWKKWWENRLLKILLVFLLSGIGSAIGTYVGAYKIISNLF
ncbi:MAG: TraB/GumN family protein [Bacteroidetes bacterium]|nr:TraB/GumN family protein [Bacteroidota bacterium]MBU1113851.1 TraB/GumN family protein [Bacteroidota bacterium]MBU1799657.1 TraB/GumN family protein [Bacteroidota bacterium]